jgi:Zn-dependent M28 family amino/carboxypeptidase
MSWSLVALLCGLAACAPRTAPIVSVPEASRVFAGAVAEVARLGADSNEARFDALTRLLTERKLRFEVEPFTIEPRKGDARTQGRNIVVTIPGRDPEIVVGAHYDAVRLADGTLSKGAVDNAASVVVLVRLAGTLAANRLRNRVRIVFFDMEELGLLGSARYIQDHPERKALAMVNLDVNAFGDTLIFGPRAGSNDAAFRAMRQVCIEVSRACVELPRMPPSDDISFQKAGIPAVSIATVPELEAHQILLLVNAGKESGLQAGFAPQILRTIHTASDTTSLVDADAMARAYRAVLALVGRLKTEK